jgi:hypothetical protein
VPRKPAVDEAGVTAFCDVVAFAGSLDPNVDRRVMVGCAPDLAFGTLA